MWRIQGLKFINNGEVKHGWLRAMKFFWFQKTGIIRDNILDQLSLGYNFSQLE